MLIQYPIGPIVIHKALMTQAADVLSFLLLLFSSYPAALLQRQFHAQVAQLPRRRVRWLAAFTTGQFLPRAEPRLSSRLRGASFVPAYLPFLQPLLPARRSVDCLLFFLFVCFLGLRRWGVKARVHGLEDKPSLELRLPSLHCLL
jgi:hypothetical protein